MRQVWCNLIGNALKYSAKRPHPEIKVYRAASRITRPPFQVQDNGAGFDMRYADQTLWSFFSACITVNEFYRPPASDSPSSSASIARHGGAHLGRGGAPEEGARFEFALPLAPASPKAPAHR